MSSKFNPYPVWKCCGVDQSPLFTTCKICHNKNKDLKLVGRDWECPKCHMIMFQGRECQSRTCKEQRLKSHEQLSMSNEKLRDQVAHLSDCINKMTKLINDNKTMCDYQIKQLKSIIDHQEDQISKLKTQINKRNQSDSVTTFGGFCNSSFYSSTKNYSNSSSNNSNEIKESQMTSVFDHPKYSGKTWADESYQYTAENGY